MVVLKDIAHTAVRSSMMMVNSVRSVCIYITGTVINNISTLSNNLI